MDWRYVSVQKQFCLHYLSETDSGDVDSESAQPYVPCKLTTSFFFQLHTLLS